MIIAEIVFAYKTDRSLTTYTYTVENRLEAVYTGTAYSQTLQMAAAYDGDGNRVYQLNYNPDKDEDLSDYYCTNNSCDYKGTGIRLQAEGEVSPAERELLFLGFYWLLFARREREVLIRAKRTSQLIIRME